MQNPIYKIVHKIGCQSYYHPYMTKEYENGLLLNTIKAKGI
ncbi:MAG: hypothetical protein ACK4YF_03565 [Exilispira sp.]